MYKPKDHFILWAISGIAGVASRDIYSFFTKQIGFAKFYIWLIGADLFLEKQSDINSFLGHVLGFMTDIVTGAMLGIVVGLLIEWRGTKNWLLKGWGIGLAAWLFLFGLLFHVYPEVFTTAPSEPLSIISAFIGHSIFGLATVLAMKKLTGFESVAKDMKEKAENEKPKTQIPRVRVVPNPARKPIFNRFKKPSKLIKLSRNLK